jgi:hypothetical protein
VVREKAIALVVTRAQRRLARAHVNDAIWKHAATLLGAAALGGVVRPFLWPIHDVSPWRAAARAAALVALCTGAALVAIVVNAWRGRPSPLTSARRIDEALGLAEVAASGFAFERDDRDDAMAGVAIDRARRVLERSESELEGVLVPVRRPRTRTEGRRLAVAGALAVVGIAIGAIDHQVVERVLHPITPKEATAAAELRRAADVAAADNAHANVEPVMDAARRASLAAERGDRKSALDALDAMR